MAQHGIEGFFDIWVRREAYGKYTGEGFFGNMPKFVSPDKSLIEYVENNQEQTCLRYIYIGEKIKKLGEQFSQLSEICERICMICLKCSHTGKLSDKVLDGMKNVLCYLKSGREKEL